MKTIPVLLAGVILAACIGCETTVLHFSALDQDSEQGGSTAAPGPPAAHELLVDEDVDLSLENTGGRTCNDGGDIVAYPISSLDGNHATLSVAPSSGCLKSGDEILLIQLQAVGAETARAGQHELLRVAEVSDNQILFVSSPLEEYGPEEANLWSSFEGRVVLQRVPHYSRLEVGQGATLSAGSWQAGSGVLALRVLGDAAVEGRIAMNGKGFRGGPRREPALSGGVQGESISGLGTDSIENNAGGGGGGLGDQTTLGCVQDGNAGGGGGHREVGSDAMVNDLCAAVGRGRGGSAYAIDGRLFLGSGGGSGGVDNKREDNPPGAEGGHGGGIVWILAQSVTGQGTIESRGLDGVGDAPGFECEVGQSTTSCYDHSGTGGGGAGGSIKLSVEHVEGVTLDVSGGRGGNGNDRSGGNGGDGSPGVIRSLNL